MSRPLVRPLAVGAVAALAIGLAACGQSAGSASSAGGNGTAAASASSSVAPVSNGSAQVHITATNAGGKDTCTVDHTAAPAGPVTFTVQNKDSSAITEVELMSEQRIIGEKENLAPGLAPTSFTVTLSGGNYEIYCPGAATATQPFTVTGQGASPKSGSAQQLLADGAKQYADYVNKNLADLKAGVDTLKQKIDAGDVAGAKTAYAQARPFYEHVESDVDGFVVPGGDAKNNKDNLDYLIDMRESNLDDAVGWHGFHAIERDLWQKGAIDGDTKQLSDELQKNVGQLVDLAKGLEYKPEDLANGAADLLDEVQSEKIKGEEEAFSHLDLIDFAANVEGAQQAFALLKPGLDQIDGDLSKQVSDQFSSVNTSLNAYRDASQPGGFKLWTNDLRDKDSASLSKTVQGLQDPLAKIAEKVATA